MPPDAVRFAEMTTRLGDDLVRFVPELLLCGAIVLMLLGRMLRPTARTHQSTTALLACAAAFAVLVVQWLSFTDDIRGGPAFVGLLVFDPFSVYLRGLILAATMVTLILSRITGLPDLADSADFATLLLGATVGMMTMTSANHLLSLFLAVEMASLPSYVLTGFLKGRPKASEAALKYVLFGAAASGIMLFGLTLLAGAHGTGLLPALTQRIGIQLSETGIDLPLLTGLLFTFAGLAFKLSAVPFHFWLPDAFEGAAAEVAGFLSVASKAAAVGLTGRLVLMLQDKALDAGAASIHIPQTVGLLLAAVAAVTATAGNLLALPQTDLKRLLGYSTIAHAGYLTMALATITAAGLSAALVYLAAYLAMNLGAFAVVAFVRRQTGGESLASLAGLMTRSPAVGASFAVFLLALLGLPPLAGFAGKFLVFSAVYDAGQTYGGSLRAYFVTLLAVGVVNAAIGAGVYLNLLKIMAFDEPEAGDTTPIPAAGVWLVAILAVALIAFGIWWSPLVTIARFAVG
jgi:NADH-quinone oxidoreductase subunit N